MTSQELIRVDSDSAQELMQVTNSTDKQIRVGVVLRYSTHLVSKENTISHTKILSLIPSRDKLAKDVLYKNLNPDETIEIFRPLKPLSGYGATLQLKVSFYQAAYQTVELYHDLGKFNQFTVYPEKIKARVSLDVLAPEDVKQE